MLKIIALIVSLGVLSACDGGTDKTAGAIRDFYKSTNGPVRAKLTIGSWSNSLELSCDDFKMTLAR